MLDRIDEYTLTNSQITSFILDKGYTNLFNIHEALSEMIDEGFISVSTIRNTQHYKITNLSDGSHTVGIKAIYQNGESDIAYYTFNVTTSISNIVESPAGMVETYNLSGQKVNRKSQLPSGIYIVKSGNKIQKIRR